MVYFALSADVVRPFGVACFLHLQGLSSLKGLFSVFKFFPLIQKSVVDSILPSVCLTSSYRTPVHRRLYSNKRFAALSYIYLYNFMKNRCRSIRRTRSDDNLSSNSINSTRFKECEHKTKPNAEHLQKNPHSHLEVLIS
jgi:hypothetical protein